MAPCFALKVAGITPWRQLFVRYKLRTKVRSPALDGGHRLRDERKRSVNRRIEAMSPLIAALIAVSFFSSVAADSAGLPPCAAPPALYVSMDLD